MVIQHETNFMLYHLSPQQANWWWTSVHTTKWILAIQTWITCLQLNQTHYDTQMVCQAVLDVNAHYSSNFLAILYLKCQKLTQSMLVQNCTRTVNINHINTYFFFLPNRSYNLAPVVNPGLEVGSCRNAILLIPPTISPQY
jgi:hypothetical protein